MNIVLEISRVERLGKYLEDSQDVVWENSWSESLFPDSPRVPEGFLTLISSGTRRNQRAAIEVIGLTRKLHPATAKVEFCKETA